MKKGTLIADHILFVTEVKDPVDIFFPSFASNECNILCTIVWWNGNAFLCGTISFRALICHIRFEICYRTILALLRTREQRYIPSFTPSDNVDVMSSGWPDSFLCWEISDFEKSGFTVSISVTGNFCSLVVGHLRDAEKRTQMAIMSIITRDQYLLAPGLGIVTNGL